MSPTTQAAGALALDILTFPITASSTPHDMLKAFSEDTFYRHFDEVFEAHVDSAECTSTPLTMSSLDEILSESETTSLLESEKIEALTMVEALDNYRRLLERNDANGTSKQDLEKCITYQFLLHGLSQRLTDLGRLMNHFAAFENHFGPFLPHMVRENVHEARKWLRILRERVLEF